MTEKLSYGEARLVVEIADTLGDGREANRAAGAAVAALRMRGCHPEEAGRIAQAVAIAMQGGSCPNFPGSQEMVATYMDWLRTWRG